MSNNWAKDINEMHKKFGVHKWVQAQERSSLYHKLNKFINFRMKMVQEEVDETNKAIEDKNPEEIVDGLIDMCVFAIGTLDAFGIDANKAWNQVMNANMSKTPGIKSTRPNPLGLPDLIKPKDWKGPDHKDNHGILSNSL